MNDVEEQDIEQSKLHFRIPTTNSFKHTFKTLKLDYPSSPHFYGMRFHNAIPRPEHLTGLNIVKWIASRYKSKSQWDDFSHASNLKISTQPDRFAMKSDEWKAHFIGHATVLLQIGRYNFLTDPVWCDYVSPQQGFGPKRFRMMGLALEQLPRIDAVLLSHNHYDHMDIATLEWLVKKYNMPIFTGLANGQYLPVHFDVIEMDWWQEQTFGEENELKIVYVPSQHGSGRGLRDQNQALWGGFSILSDSGHAYFAGDAAYSPYFQEIRERLGAPRIALLPIGAYEPRYLMQYLHMNPDDAVKAHIDLQSKQSLAIHHRMFQLTDESMFAPEQDLAKALIQYNIDYQQFICLEEGQYCLV